MFKKGNISHAIQQTALNDADHPFKSLEEELGNLRKLNHSAVQDNLSAEPFIGLDSEVVTSASYMSDTDILTEVISDFIKDHNDDVIEDLDSSTPLTLLFKSDVSLFSSYGNAICSLTLKIEIF